MKFRIIRLILILAFLMYCLFLKAQEYYASDMGWTCVGRDSFIIQLTVYKDCNTGPPPGTFDVYLQTYREFYYLGVIFDTLTISYTASMDVTPTCSSACNRCSSSSCTVPYGIQKFQYDGLVVIPLSIRICEIKAGVYIGSRSSGITTGSAGQGFYTYCAFSHCLYPYDNSPVFSEMPIIIQGIGNDLVYNSGLIDKDTNSSGGLLDSVRYDITYPLSSDVNSISYTSPYNSREWLFYWGIPNSTLPFPRGCRLDYETGEILLRPMKIDQSLTTLEIKEYRNSVKIGEIRREMYAIVIYPSIVNPPSFGPGIYYKEVCAGSPVTFIFNSSVLDSNDSLTISWNHGISGATWTDNNGRVKKPSGVFSWTPSANISSTVPFRFSVTVKDNRCPFPRRYTQQFQVLVKQKPKAEIKITDSCGGLFYLKAIKIIGNNPSFRWFCDSLPEKFNLKGQSVFHRISTPGIYPFSISMTAEGCSQVYSDSIIADTFFYTVLPLDSVVCKGSILTIKSASFHNKGKVSYKWNSSGADTFDYVRIIADSNQKIMVLATDSSGCSVSDQMNIRVLQLPVSFAGTDTIVCRGDTVLLSAKGGSRYLWCSGQTSDFIKVSPANTTTFSVVVFDSNYCHSADTVVVFVNQLPVCKVSADTNVCFGDTAKLLASGGLNYNWSTGDLTADIKMLPLISGYIKVITFDSNSCHSTDSVYIRVNPVPKADAGNDTFVCKGQSVNLHASGGIKYRWSNGDSMAVLKVTPLYNQTYEVLVTDSNSCSTTAHVKLQVLPVPLADAGRDTSFCSGGTAVLTATAARHFLWNTGDTTATIRFVPAKTAYYKVFAKDNNVCISADSVLVIIYPLPQADFVANPLSGPLPLKVTFSDESAIESGRIIQYIWNFGDITGATGSIAQHIYNLSGNYDVRLVVISDNKCSDTVKKEKYILVQPSGIEKTQKTQKIIISPNPGNCVIYVKVVNEENRIISLRLTDIFGREVVTMKNLHSESVKIDSPGKGIYYLQAWLEGGSLVSGRLIFE